MKNTLIALLTVALLTGCAAFKNNRYVASCPQCHRSYDPVLRAQTWNPRTPFPFETRDGKRVFVYLCDRDGFELAVPTE